MNFKITILGLSITSSWGNGHATTYRGLVRALVERGHEVLFLERDRPWYAANRDLPKPPFGRTCLYSSLEELNDEYAQEVRTSELVIVGSFLPDGVAVSKWVHTIASGITAFYDIDTPITLARLASGDGEYITRELVPRFDLYLSFTGGPTLDVLRRQYRALMPRPLYCSVDPEFYYPEPVRTRFDLGYMGTYSDDRQPALERLLVEPARRWARGRFVIAGPQYPDDLSWPRNVRRIEHLSPAEHRKFYCSQRFTLNVTRSAMVRSGYSPSVRLFEAAACGTPILSDAWPGLEEFFVIGEEILLPESPEEALRCLRGMPDEQRIALGERARRRVLASHTAMHRAEQLEHYLAQVCAQKA